MPSFICISFKKVKIINCINWMFYLINNYLIFQIKNIVYELILLFLYIKYDFPIVII